MKTNLDYYKGKDFYTDGEIEKDINKYVVNESDYEKILEQDSRFPVVYHLSSIRENILNWYPFKKDASVLEIGAGMGAITSMLCDKAKKVVAVELSRQRAYAIEERCKNKDNLELIIGNLNDIEFKEKFDYITLIGVLEYAALYTYSQNPYETFLNKIKNLLKKDGKLLIAIENKFGMKYFSGIPEDHTGIKYDSIVGYQNKNGIKTFGRNEIIELLKKVGLNENKFYYPLPDYKLPNVIFTDEYLPNDSTIIRNLQYYNKNDILNFDEACVYKEMIKEDPKLFPTFANSFFIEAGEEPIETDIKSVFFNNWRKEKYQLKTIIDSKKVTKIAISKKSNNHIQAMRQILEKMKEQGILTIDYYENNSIVSERIHEPNYEEYLTKLYINTDIDEICREINKFYDNLKKTLKKATDTTNTVFEKYHVEITESIKQRLNFVQDGIFDLRFGNCFYINNQFYFHDQEWIEKNVPIEFIIYRSLNDYNKITLEEKQKIYEFLGIDNYIEIFEKLEKALVVNIKKEKFSRIFDKPRMMEDVLRDVLKDYNRLKADMEELNRNYNQILNSRTFKYANKIKRVVFLPVNIIKKCKTKVKFIIKNFYKRIKAYSSEYQENIDFSDMKTDIKILAFYLPQFHIFKENDEWWGKGFTEWINARKSIPRYPEHYQPRLPHDDIGFYDLTDINTIKKQANLAKQHGIYGFCFYYYWFSGKRLMEKPVDLLLNHSEIDTNFCLCWANENWTRKWDGQDKNVLIAQEYSDDDPIRFIRDIKKYIDDKRYIRVDGKPVVMIYNPSVIPNINNVIKIWRKEAKKIGIGEIVVWTRNLLVDNKSPIEEADAEFDFPPLQKGFQECLVYGINGGYVYNYRILVEKMMKLYHNYKHPKKLYYGTTMAWDNSARRKNGFTILHGFSLESFYDWNRAVIKKTREMHPKEERFMFVNAWNEWREGTYLEPDQKYGYANINTLSKALFNMPFEELKVINDKKSQISNLKRKIAVQVHLFYPDLCKEIIEHLNQIPYDFDCFITTNNMDKKKIIEKEFTQNCIAKKIVIEVTQNRGRDVAPFLVQMSKVIDKYDYICHIHSKKSKTVDYGNTWRKYLYENLFGTKENVIQIFNEFEKDPKLGVVFPEIYPVIADEINNYGVNLKFCKKAFKRLGIPQNYIHEKLIFPAGTMFWAKKDAIKPLFKVNYKYSDFAIEENQIDATPAHAIERVICNLAISRGYKYLKTYNNTITEELINKQRQIIFCHYNSDGIIDENDLHYLNRLKDISNNIVFITNTNLKEEEIPKVTKIISTIVKTNAINYCKMWKNYLINNEINTNIEEVIITNNNNILTKLPLEPLVNNVGANECYSLGYTWQDDSTNKALITDFMILKTSLIKDIRFKIFLRELRENTLDYDLQQFICENNMKYDIYLKETNYINNYIINKPIDKKDLYLMIILGSPLINKQAFNMINDVQKNKINNFINQIKNKDI